MMLLSCNSPQSCSDQQSKSGAAPKRSIAARSTWMPKAHKYVEKAITVAANGAWIVVDKLNSIKPTPSFTPKWSDKRLLKSDEKQKPPQGRPRTTHSLCPR